MSENNPRIPQPVELTVDGNRPMATSMQIARHFNKRHAYACGYTMGYTAGQANMIQEMTR